MTKRGKQGTKVVHGAEEDTADENPQEHRHPAEDGSLDGAVDGTGAGNGREVVAEHHVGLGGHVVGAVLKSMRRGDVAVVETPLLREPSAVGDIAHDEDDDRNEKNECGVHSLQSSFFSRAAGARFASRFFLMVLPAAFVITRPNSPSPRSTTATRRSLQPQMPHL